MLFQAATEPLGQRLSGIADLLRGIAAVLWVLLWIGIVFYYRGHLAGILGRFKKGKGFGVELELDNSLRELSERANEAVVAEPQTRPAGAPLQLSFADDVVEGILREAGRSPRAALMLLSAEIDHQIYLLGAQSGWMLAGPPGQLWAFLLKQGVVPSNLTGALELFRDIRNKIVHGMGATDTDILRAIDSGVVLLRTVLQVPREANRVKKTNVPLFADDAGRTPIDDVVGILLETTSPGGTGKGTRIFPTTKTDYEVGKLVSWEWNMSRTVGPAWYRDDTTERMLQAWHQSAEFIGRHLD